MSIKLLSRIILLFIPTLMYSPWSGSREKANELSKPRGAVYQSLAALEQLPNDFSQLGYTEVGKAKFTFLFWDIYKSTLFTKTGRYDDMASADLIYKIEYLKDITAKELIKRTVEQWQHLKVEESQYQPFVPLLKAIWPDIKSGDSLTLYRSETASVFYFNNKKIGIIESNQFGKLFVDIWLSPNTSEPELRKTLLGQER